ncbi:MAG: 50S ribosomal protein L7ae [Candidatus Lokiarchaeota archaeon]|nr:50S ribosomal protein L7ae [Candidatus Lokiarchaeota archaeon]
MTEFNEYKVSEELERMALEALEVARDTGRVKKGINEVTKSIERANARIVYIADDIVPPEIAMHIPYLCKEKKVPFLVVGGKKKLGKTVGIEVPTSSVAITNPGDGEKMVRNLAKKLLTE